MAPSRAPPGWEHSGQQGLVRTVRERAQVGISHRWIVGAVAFVLCVITWAVLVGQLVDLARNDIGEAVPWKTRAVLDGWPTWFVLGLDTVIVSALVAIPVLSGRPTGRVLVVLGALAAGLLATALLHALTAGFFSGVTEQEVIAFAAIFFTGCWIVGVAIGLAVVRYR